MSFAYPKPRQKRELPLEQKLGEKKHVILRKQGRNSVSEAADENIQVNGNRKGNWKPITKRPGLMKAQEKVASATKEGKKVQKMNEEKAAYLAELTRQAEEAARVLDREREALTKLKIQEEETANRIQRSRSNHNDHQIQLARPEYKEFYQSKNQIRSNIGTPDKMRPSYVDPKSVPGLVVPSREVSKAPSSALSSSSSQNKNVDTRVEARSRIRSQYSEAQNHVSSSARGLNKERLNKPSKDSTRTNIKINESKKAHTEDTDPTSKQRRSKHKSIESNKEIASLPETPEVESDYTSGSDESDWQDFNPRNNGKNNKLRTVAEEPDRFSDDSSIFDETTPKKKATIGEPDINFSEIERREEAAIAARAEAAASELLSPQDALSPGGGRRFMGAMQQLRAGPSEHQIERQQILKNKLKLDLEAQIEERRIKEKQFKEEQKAREEKDEAEFRAYHDRLDRLRAASPDTKAREKARLDQGDIDSKTRDTFQRKEESIVGLAPNVPKLRRSDVNAQKRTHLEPKIKSFSDDEDVEDMYYDKRKQSREQHTSFGQTIIRRDVAILKEQQQQLLQEIHQLQEVTQASKAIEKLQEDIYERKRVVEIEVEKIRSEAIADAEKIRLSAEAEATKGTVFTSPKGKSMFMNADPQFLISEELVPKDTNYIPDDDELLRLRIDPNDLVSYPVRDNAMASPSPDSALMLNKGGLPTNQTQVRENHNEATRDFGIVDNRNLKVTRIPPPPKLNKRINDEFDRSMKQVNFKKIDRDTDKRLEKRSLKVTTKNTVTNIRQRRLWNS